MYSCIDVRRTTVVRRVRTYTRSTEGTSKIKYRSESRNKRKNKSNILGGAGWHVGVCRYAHSQTTQIRTCSGRNIFTS